MAASQKVETSSAAGLLEKLGMDALALAKTARKHRQNLSGDNFYGNKLAELRADATNAFRDLSAQTAGDSSALAELVESAFAPGTEGKARATAVRELKFALRTTWRPKPDGAPDDPDLFPLAILAQAKRGYLVTVGRQMNGCFHSGWFDACAVMMRRLVEIVIIEAFEAHGIAGKVTDAKGDYVQLTDLVNAALSESAWRLSRNAKKYLPQLRDLGHQSAHGRYFTARREDIEYLRSGCRVVVEEFLYHAKLI